MTKEYHVFISSKMVELANERLILHELLPTLGNDLIRLRSWIFEDDAPASNQTIREIYLDALKSSALYIGLYWNDYGEWTVDEFHKATEWSIDRHIYVKNVNPEQRDPRLTEFLHAQSDVISGITPKWFTTDDDLREQVTRSIEVWLQDHLQRRPGDSTAIIADSADDIPELPKKLIGRTDIVDHVRASLDDGSNVLLQGFGGMGKSAIAATVAANWLDDGMGNIVWYKAGSEGADIILEAIAKPFDDENAVTTADSNAKVKLVRKLLSDNEISLVILDDVWDGAALSQVIKAIPRRVPVLVTARQRYALDEILEIGRMNEDEAVALLSYHSRQKYSDKRDANELCRQLGYHAFALEVAGKTLKVDQIEPINLLKRIESTPHDMVMPEDFAEEGRSSITELLDASLYALDDLTRRVFLAFGGLFSAEATSDLMAKLMPYDEVTIHEALTTLQRRGLAERLTVADSEIVYFRIHNLAYSYARTIAKSHGRGPESHVTAIVDYVNDHAEDLTLLDITRSNWMGAAQTAREHNLHESLVNLMHPLVYTYLGARGHTLTFLDLLDSAIASAEILGDTYDETRHYLLSKRGNTYHQRGDYIHAINAYQTALAIARKLGMKDREVILLSVMASMYAEQGNNLAQTLLNEAYALADESNDDFLRGFVLENQAYYAQSIGDYEATREFSAKQAMISERINDRTTQVFALLNLGTAEKILGEIHDALQHHQQMLQIAQTEKNDVWIAHALQGLGEDYHALGKRSEARKHLIDALNLFRECGIQSNVNEIEQFLSQEDYD